MIPFLPYRTLRDHFLDYPLGANMLTILLLAVIVGALIKQKSLPKSKLYSIWLVYGAYLYVSMWIGTVLGNAPAPLWISDANFATWKDYMIIPLVFWAAGMVIEDRKSIRMVVILAALALVLIDRSNLMESLSRNWSSFDEQKRDPGPLGYGPNQTGAFLAQFGAFFWGFSQFLKKWKLKIVCYAIVALTFLTAMYTFSRGAYLAILVAVLLLGLLKNRKLLVLLGVFLLTWQTIVPPSVRERVLMTKGSDGQLEDSAQERVDLWQNAEQSFLRSPIVGNGYATFQLSAHVGDLRDTHNWYVKVAVETGIVGLLITLFLLQQLVSTSYRLFKTARDPLYQGLGLGLFLAICASMVANFFGDRWTYVEITALLFVLVGAATRALQLDATAPLAQSEATALPIETKVNPYLAYR
jgi:O-antigen ligase